MKADGDGDKVFDDLEVRLANTSATTPVPVIVTMKNQVSATQTASLQATAGPFRVDKQIKLIDAFSTKLTKGQVDALSRDPAVEHVEEDSTVQAFNATPQQAFGVTQARLEAPALDGDGDGNPGSYSKKDMVAAVIDTGIDATHLDLDGGKVLAFKDYVNGKTTPYDDNGHGTHVAATIAGDGDASTNHSEAGVAPAGALVGIKVLNSAGSGSMSDVAAAIDWIVANKDVYGIKSANLSLGTTGCADGTDAASLAVDRAVAAGIVMAIAAGNSGPGTCTIGRRALRRARSRSARWPTSRTAASRSRRSRAAARPRTAA
jgi:serine protease AprX